MKIIVEKSLSHRSPPGLLDLRKNLEARAATTYAPPPKPSEQTIGTDKRDRVLGTGARTPRSLAADAQRQAEHRQKFRPEDPATRNL
ncbi:uncharacterized protein J7T54_002549 [Emericellopsis cladophorae]|uniref:Uncharacterized protein n=1 Tax=Emericellopsis cladophorae TaxID=2686198 RepID=A0A9P9Y104_9HYPO|nr:uncharacterized protein J7T54_002549 [Emericellopsis cladophorae]KAI6781193.1 hypothetical protein J7T54_002549 [Emericellopsis cladophorae]